MGDRNGEGRTHKSGWERNSFTNGFPVSWGNRFEGGALDIRHSSAKVLLTQHKGPAGSEVGTAQLYTRETSSTMNEWT